MIRDDIRESRMKQTCQTEENGDVAGEENMFDNHSVVQANAEIHDSHVETLWMFDLHNHHN